MKATRRWEARSTNHGDVCVEVKTRGGRGGSGLLEMDRLSDLDRFIGIKTRFTKEIDSN